MVAVAHQLESNEEHLTKLMAAVHELTTTTKKLEVVVAKMEPHVATVANAKTFWEWSGKLGALALIVGSTGYGIVIALKPYFVWR